MTTFYGYADSIGPGYAEFEKSYTPGVAPMLRAFRGGAPGGWSDDRIEQSRHYTGVVFTAIRALGDAAAAATLSIQRPAEASA